MISNPFSHPAPLISTRRVLRSLALVVALGATAVACGDDGAAAPNPTTDSGTSSAPTTTTQPDDAMSGATGEAMSGATGESTQPGDLVVVIDKVKFQTTEISVTRGSEVTFDNQDSQAHTATADDQSFDTGLLQADEMGKVTFAEAGTFAYHCSLHPFMKATVVVT